MPEVRRVYLGRVVSAFLLRFPHALVERLKPADEADWPLLAFRLTGDDRSRLARLVDWLLEVR